jgi:type VI secretion system protein ImpK
MTVLDLCEPLFARVCLLNRIGRKGGGQYQYDQLRAEVEALLKQLAEQAEKEPALRQHWPLLEMPLIFFVDSMIAESGLQVAPEWHKRRLAYERRELAGDEKFFDLLDETLADPSDEATERLWVYYTCLGLGFAGWYAAQPEYLRGKMADISQRLHLADQRRPAARICPEAYQHLDTRDLIQPRVSRLGGLAVIFVGLCLVVAAAEIYLFRAAALSIIEATAAISKVDPRQNGSEAAQH